MVEFKLLAKKGYTDLGMAIREHLQIWVWLSRNAYRCFGTLMCAHTLLQVKIAEHVLTGHKVAIKILHRKKIKAMDMEEKGGRTRHRHHAVTVACWQQLEA